MHRGSLLHYILGLAKAEWLARGGEWKNQSMYDEKDHSFSNDVGAGHVFLGQGPTTDLPIYYPDISDTAGPHEV